MAIARETIIPDIALVVPTHVEPLSLLSQEKVYVGILAQAARGPIAEGGSLTPNDNRSLWKVAFKDSPREVLLHVGAPLSEEQASYFQDLVSKPVTNPQRPQRARENISRTPIVLKVVK